MELTVSAISFRGIFGCWTSLWDKGIFGCWMSLFDKGIFFLVPGKVPVTIMGQLGPEPAQVADVSVS